MELSRLISLIEYAQEAARLKLQPTHNVTTHEFYVFEHDCRGLPGIHYNCSREDREIWLAIERLRETTPPAPNDKQLLAWLQPSNKPTKKPELREYIEIDIEIPQEHNNDTSTTNQQPNKHRTLSALSDYEDKHKIKSMFSSYLTDKWLPWAAEEKKRRQAIKLYNEIFNLKQQIEGTLADDQVEIVWGIGIAVGIVQERNVCHPLLTIAADIHINDKTMALEIGPRDVDEQLEIDIFMSANNPGAVDLERAYIELAKTRTQTLSPFDRNSFEPILREAAKHLDAE